MSRATVTVALAAVLAVAVVAAVGGASKDDSGTESSVTTSERSDGGDDTTATRTPSLQSAFDAAKHLLDNEAVSKTVLLTRLAAGVGKSYSKADLTYAVNHLDADWKAEALEGATNDLNGISKKRMGEYLAEAGFSKAEVTYAVDRARDWKAEAVKEARSYLDEAALSESQLIEELKLWGFTDAEVRYALEKVD